MEIDALPEEIFRKIFDHFPDAEIYFKFRCINKQFKQYAENYVQLGKLALIELMVLINVWCYYLYLLLKFFQYRKLLYFSH